LLAPGHRPDRQITGATRQRFRNPAHQEEVCGTSQQKATRSSFPVDCTLDGPEQVGLALYLVKGDWLGAPNQRVGIFSGGFKHIKIVKRQILLTRSTALPFSRTTCRESEPNSPWTKSRPGRLMRDVLNGQGHLII